MRASGRGRVARRISVVGKHLLRLSVEVDVVEGGKLDVRDAAVSARANHHAAPFTGPHIGGLVRLSSMVASAAPAWPMSGGLFSAPTESNHAGCDGCIRLATESSTVLGTRDAGVVDGFSCNGQDGSKGERREEIREQ